MPLSRLIAILASVILAAGLTVWLFSALSPTMLPILAAVLLGAALALRLLGRR